MFQSKRARRSAQLLRRCESHDTSHCVLKSGPGLPLSSPIQCLVTTASDSSRSVRYDLETSPSPPICPAFMGLGRVESTVRLRLPGWRFFAAARPT